LGHGEEGRERGDERGRFGAFTVLKVLLSQSSVSILKVDQAKM
jgi:hypothetical protein